MLLPLDDKFRRDHREVQSGLQPVVRLLRGECINRALNHSLRSASHATREQRPVQTINEFRRVARIREPRRGVEINAIRLVKSDATVANQP